MFVSHASMYTKHSKDSKEQHSTRTDDAPQPTTATSSSSSSSSSSNDDNDNGASSSTSAILYCFMAGEASELSEKEMKSSIINKVIQVLQKMFGVRNVPAPIASCVTEWGKDRFARSAYSFVATGCTGNDYDVLAESVSDVLYFGGEHTNRSHPTTCAGAMLSGWREAGKIAATHGRWRTDLVNDLMHLNSVWDKQES